MIGMLRLVVPSALVGQRRQWTAKLPAVRIGHGANFVERTAAVLAYNMAAKIVIERL